MPPETINNFFPPVSTGVAHQNIDELMALNTLKDAGSISAADPLWNKYLQGAEAVGDWLVEMFPPSPGVSPGTPEYGQAQENIRTLFGLIPKEKWEVPFLAAGGIFPKGTVHSKQLDITDLRNWSRGKDPLYSDLKVYHGTPIKRKGWASDEHIGGMRKLTEDTEILEEPLRAGIHVGSPGAAIDRLSKKVPWSADPEYNMGTVHGMLISPTKALTKRSPDYDYISKELWKQDKSLSSYYGGGSKSPHPYIIDEFSDVDKKLLELMGSPENVKLISDLGYDVIPYINFFEHPHSVSLNVLNPEKAGLQLIDEVYTVPTPFRQSSQAYLKQFDDSEPYNEIEIIQDLIDAVTIP